MDLVVTDYSRHPNTTAIDITVSCPMLQSHAAAAARDAAALFAARAAEKNNKHLAGSIAQERAFLPIVFSTLGGIGPPEALHYLDAFFAESYAAERAATGTTRHTAHLRTSFLQSLLATLTSATADMASRLTHAAAAAPAAPDDAAAAPDATVAPAAPADAPVTAAAPADAAVAPADTDAR